MSAQAPDAVFGPRVESALHADGKASGGQGLDTERRWVISGASGRPFAASMAKRGITDDARAENGRAGVARTEGRRESAVQRPAAFAD